MEFKIVSVSKGSNFDRNGEYYLEEVIVDTKKVLIIQACSGHHLVGREIRPKESNLGEQKKPDLKGIWSA